MNHRTPKGLVLLLLIALAIGLWGSTAQAAGEAESDTDIVFALDVSRSMQTDNNFGKVRDRLIEFIQDELDLETNVVVITFGADVRLVARQMVKNDADKAALIGPLKQVKADAEGTYIAGGVEMALEQLRALRRQSPDRTGMLVMLTDGKNEPPDNVPPDQLATFDKLRTKYGGLADFKPNKDWFFWYCFIGDAEKEVREFAESMGGESKPVVGPWKFLKVRFNRGLVKLPDVSPGNWTSEYPTAADRQLGDVLSVSTRNPGQYDLQISNVILDDAKPGERIAVAPRIIRMDKREQPVVLKLVGENIAPGERRGRIIFRAPGKMVFVQPQQLTVTFRAVEAVVTVTPGGGVQFGRLLPGGSVERTIELVPNEAASRLATGKPLRLALPKDLPGGVQLVAEPASPQLGAATSVRLKMIAAADAALPAEGYRGTIEFSGVTGLGFRPSTLPVSFEASRPEIDVLPETVDFGTVAPGSESMREIVLIPNEVAAAVGATMVVSADASLPKGLTLEMEPAQTAVKAKTSIRLKLRVAADTALTGDLQGTVSLKTADRAIAVAHPQIVWRTKTAEAVIDVTPGDQIDFGELEPGQRQTRSLWLTPSRAAAARKPRVRFSADAGPQGGSVSFSPPEVTVEAKREIQVTLTAGRARGPQQLRLKLACDSPGAELAARELAAKYSGQEGGIVIDARELKYADLFPGECRPELRVRVAASPGAIGDTVRLAWSFEGLPKGMAAKPTLEQFTVSQPSEQVLIELAIQGGVAGTYQGKVRFTAKSRVRPAELPVQIHVTQRLVELVDTPEEWLIKVSPFFPRGTRELPLVARASRAAAGTTILLRSPAELTDGIALEVDPSPLKVKPGENPVNVTATVELRRGFLAQEFAGQMDVVVDAPQTVVHPATLRWRVVVPGLWPYLAGAIALVLVLWWPHRRVKVLSGNEEVGGLKLEKRPEAAKVLLQGAEKAEGAMLLIGKLRKYNVYVGSPGQARVAISDVVVQGDSAVRPRHVRIFRRGSRHWIQAMHPITIVVGDTRRSVGRGRKERLYNDDKLQIGQAVLVFRNPGDPRPQQAMRRR